MTVSVCGNEYVIMDCPEPITTDGGRYRFQIDHDQQVIWLDPGLGAGRSAAIARAVAAAWADRTQVRIVA